MELVLFIVDQPVSRDAAQDAKRYKAGDVIEARPDGFQWGREDCRNPNWRIIRVPGMQPAEAETLLARELPTAFAPNRMLQRRRLKLDIEQLDIMEGGAILGERKATPKGVDAIVSRANLLACLSIKPPRIDPRIIGPRRGVVG